MSEGGIGEHGLEGENKTVAMLIAVLALALAIAESLGQSAQTETLQKNIEASDIWAQYQAKTVRKSVADTAAEQLQAMLAGITEPNLKKAMQTQVAAFQAASQHLESDEVAHDGRHQLVEKAHEAEHERDRMGKRHHRFELSKGAFQIAIVLASATVITGIAALLWVSGGLGVLGLVMMLSGILV